jgi:PAS domain S-box-containing protein
MAAKILVVDQDPDIRDMLAKSLRQEGYDVAVAVDGREAIDQFKTLATDLVITRIPIPKTDDENMLRAVKAHAPLTEVIILTGNGTLINTISTLENDGTFHYLAKPFEDIQAFLTTVHNALERQQLRRQNQLLRDKVHASNRLCEEKSSAAEAARLDLQKTLERNASVMNAIPSGIMELDTQGMVKFANTACYQLFGLPPEELSGRLVYELMPNKAQRKDVRDYIENLVARTPQPTPKVVTGRSTRGEVLDLQVNWTYQCSSDGVLTGFIAVLTDITAQKRANEEHLQLEKRLVKAQKKQAISTLAGGIAHRFNNALAAVTGNLELLGQVTEGDPKINTYIERIMDQTEEMAQQTQKLLAYAEGGKYRAKHLDLGAFVKESLPIIRFGLEEECDIQYLLEQTAIGIKVDPTQLELVLSALVQNAAEATDADGSIWISTANVQAPPDTLPKLTPGPYA